MTTINVKFRRPDGITVDGALVTSGQVVFSVANRYSTADGEMMPIQLTAPVNTSIELAAGPWRADITLAAANIYTETRYVSVPGYGNIDIDALTEIDPATLTPSTPLVSEDHVALVALQAEVAAMDGGASNLAGINGMTDYMRIVNTSVDADAARSVLGAGQSSVEIGNTTGTAGDGGLLNDITDIVASKADDSATAHINNDETIGGTWTFTNAPTMGGYYTADQIDLAITTAVAAATITMTTALNGTPMFLFTSAGVYPPRPATGRPVIFRDPTVQPANDGDVLGGGGMVPGLDMWFGS